MIRVHFTVSPNPAKRRLQAIGAVAAALAVLPVLALASPVEPLESFAAGEPIVAADFNANFSAVAEAVDDNDARISAIEGSADGGVPPGAVVFFDAAECPEGWAELTEARGRAIVGMNGSAATLLGTVGQSLDDLENPTHSHSTDIAMFNTGSASVAHTHSVPSHSTASAGSHNHQWRDNQTVSYNASGSPVVGAPFPASSGPGVIIPNWGSADLYTDNDGAHSHSVTSFNTGSATSTSHAHSVNPPPTNSSGVSAGDIVPYVQLLACRRGG